MTECVTDYVKFCVNNTISNSIVRYFPRNKLWIASNLKKNFLKTALREGCNELLRSIQQPPIVKIGDSN